MNEKQLVKLLANPQSHLVGSRHHLLPKMYLRRFANGGSILTRVDRATGEAKQISIDTILSQKDFYTIVEEDGSRSGQMEALLGTLEAEASDAFRQLTHPLYRQLPVPPDHRLAIANFAGMQCVRGQKWRRVLEAIVDLSFRIELNSVNASNVDEFIAERRLTPTDELRAEILGTVENLDSFEVVPHQNEHLRHMGDLFGVAWQALYWRPIRVVRFPEPCLLTCDEPVVPLPPSLEDAEAGVRGGLLSAYGLWMPLDQRHLLAFGPLGSGLSPEFVVDAAEVGFDPESVNTAIMANSYKWIVVGDGVPVPSADKVPGPAPVMSLSGDLAVDLPGWEKVVSNRDPIGRLRSTDMPTALIRVTAQVDPKGTRSS